MSDLQVNSIELAATTAFLLAADETERDAVLLEVCDLPDKKLTLSEADLDGIVSRFSPDTPVKIEHQNSIFDPLGTVQRIWRDGSRLLGRLSFTPEMASFLRAKGTVKLSCGLKRMSDDLQAMTLSEVSLVLKPRLPVACLLSEDDASELLRLRIEVQQQKVDAQVVSLKLAGKLVPATEAAARVLLMADDHSQITLADGNNLAVAEAFKAYLDAQPPLITLGQLTQLAGVDSQADGNASTILTTDQREFLQKSLGVNPDDVVKTMDADKNKMASGAIGRQSLTASFPGLSPRPTAQEHKSSEKGL
jgi:hypothetical protein